MNNALPKKLSAEPLIDAIFEMRFTSLFPAASEIIPGYLFSKLIGDKSVTTLPTAQLPKVTRETNPNLLFAPVTQLDWVDFLSISAIAVLVLAVNCLILVW